MAQFERNETHDAAPTGEEILAMAVVLKRRYQDEAAAVASHFAAEHEAIGDTGRASHWLRVAECINAPAPAPTLS
jgi:hypothetical protein